MRMRFISNGNAGKTVHLHIMDDSYPAITSYIQLEDLSSSLVKPR